MKLSQISLSITLLVTTSFLNYAHSTQGESRVFEQKGIVTHSNIIPNNYSEWEFLEHIPGSGGGTGVHVYKDPSTQKKFTVKDATHQNHLIEEIVAKALYRVLGFNAPNFTVLDRTSSLWPKLELWNKKFSNTPRVLISQFIEKGVKEIGQGGKYKEKLLRWIEVLLGNFDLPPHNYIVDDDEEIWPIDFGGSLRLRANGQRKVLEDLWGYFWPKNVTVKPPTKRELADFRSRITPLFNKLLDLHHELSIPDFPSLWNIVASRVHSFLQTFDPEHAPQFWGDRPAIEGQVAGGALFVCDFKGIPHALLAKRGTKWGDVGGGAVAVDQVISCTAWREGLEEIGRFLCPDYSTLAVAPYIEHAGEIFYRMYLLKVDFFDVEALKLYVKSKRNPYKVEHDDYMLVPLDSLHSQDLYGPMRDLLSTTHARKLLENFSKGHRLRQEKGSSVFEGRMRLGDYSFDTLKLDLLPPKVLRGKILAAREMRHKLKPPPLPVTLITPPYLYTASEGMIRALLGDSYLPGQDVANLTKLLLEKSSYFRGKPELLSAHLPAIQRIIGRETLYPNHFGSYHGSKGHFGLLWVLGSILREHLFLDSEAYFRTLRFYEIAFDKIFSLPDHFNALTHDGNGDDYAKGGQARILSVNLSLFGSLGRETSETLTLYYGNSCVSEADDPRELLLKLLGIAWMLPKMVVDQFMAEVMPYFDSLNSVGALWQLLLPVEAANHYTYLSHPGGKRAILKGQQATATTINSPVPFLEVLRRTPNLIHDVVQDLDFGITQGRVLLHPDMLYNTSHVHPAIHFADGRSATDIHQHLSKLVSRILVPHLHFASTQQTFTALPRLIQLHNLMTGRAQDAIDPRLLELVTFVDKNTPPLTNQKPPFMGDSEDLKLERIDEFLNSAIVIKLRDPTIARLEKIDPLTLRRVSGFELSPLLRPLADDLRTQVRTLTPTQWEAFLDGTSTRFRQIMDFLDQQKLKDASQTIADLAHLLTVDREDPNFERLKHVILCNNVQIILRTSYLEEMNKNMGKVLATLFRWEKKRRAILRALMGVGLVVCDGKTDNSQIAQIDPEHKHEPDKVLEAVSMLQSFPLKRPPHYPHLPASSASDDMSLKIVNDILGRGIVSSRQALHQIYSDLEISNPILFSIASQLLHLHTEFGKKWLPVARDFVRLLKKYTDEFEIIQPLEFLFCADIKKVETTLATIEAMGLLQPGTNLGFIPFLSALCASPDPLGTLAHLKPFPAALNQFHTLHLLIQPENLVILSKLIALRLPSGQLYPSTLMSLIGQIKGMSPQQQQETLRFIEKMIPYAGTNPSYMDSVFRGLVDIVVLHTSRLVDIEALLPFCTSADGCVNTQELNWALRQGPQALPQVTLFFQLGLNEVHETLLPRVAQNLDLYRRQLGSLRPIIDNLQHRDKTELELFFKLIDGKQLSEAALRALTYFSLLYKTFGDFTWDMENQEHMQAVPLFYELGFDERNSEVVPLIARNLDLFTQNLEAMKEIVGETIYSSGGKTLGVFLKFVDGKQLNASDLKALKCLYKHYSLIELSETILTRVLSTPLPFDEINEHFKDHSLKNIVLTEDFFNCMVKLSDSLKEYQVKKPLSQREVQTVYDQSLHLMKYSPSYYLEFAFKVGNLACQVVRHDPASLTDLVTYFSRRGLELFSYQLDRMIDEIQENMPESLSEIKKLNQQP